MRTVSTGCLLWLTVLLVVVSNCPTQAELPELITVLRCDTHQTKFGYRIVPLGDQNADGYDDFITWDHRVRAFIFLGGDPGDTIPYLQIDSVSLRISNIGDLNGDGFCEFAMMNRTAAYWKLNLYYGGPLLDATCDAWFGIDTLFGQGFSVLGDDINANGTNEIISWSYGGLAGQCSVLLFELGYRQDSIPDLVLKPPNQTPEIDYVQFGEGITAGDFNGDGKRDLAVSYRPDFRDSIVGSVYLYWGGAEFDTIPDLIISHPYDYVNGADNFGGLLENLGDINADSYDDFYAGSGVAADDSVNFVYFGGPNLDTIPDLIIRDRQTRVRRAGDINHDGHNDFITSYPAPWSGMGDVYIYFGGPDVDNLPDVHIHNDDMPEFQQYFGEDCSGIGDYNGDGIDDFAFSAVPGDNHGTIYIFAGWDGSTGVSYEYEPTLPERYVLHQNYPNPFNMGTVVQFDLPQRSRVSLAVHNVLGQKRATLLDEVLLPGRHRVTWNARDDRGRSIPSGVYFCRLKTESFSETIKMLLLK